MNSIEKFEQLWKSNKMVFRLLRTIIQGVLGILISNLDMIIGTFTIDPGWKPFIVALVMAVLSPIMASFGKNDDEC